MLQEAKSLVATQRKRQRVSVTGSEFLSAIRQAHDAASRANLLAASTVLPTAPDASLQLVADLKVGVLFVVY